MGLAIPAESIFTSALATAAFLDRQRPRGSANAVGETGLITALHQVGYVLTEHRPEYVVLGETVSLSFEHLSTAVRLVAAGSRFIATNRDVVSRRAARDAWPAADTGQLVEGECEPSAGRRGSCAGRAD